MKKIFKTTLVIALSLVCASAFSQDNKEKELKVIPEGVMPQQGDISLGVNLKPLLKYAGNMFNGDAGNSLDEFGGEPLNTTGTYSPDYSIMGKYMFTDKMAFRANIGLYGENTNTRSYTPDLKALVEDPNSKEQVVNSTKTKRNGFSLSLGAEFHKRYRRIQGYAGASLFYANSSSTNKYTYGNGVTDLNPGRGWTAGEWAAIEPGYAFPTHFDGLNMTERRVERENMLGLVGFVGVEWFFAPKVSIGGEISLPLLFNFGGQTYTKFEGWNNATMGVDEYTVISAPGNRGFNYETSNLGGNIFINFYF